MAVNAIEKNSSDQLVMWHDEEIALASSDEIGIEVDRVNEELKDLTAGIRDMEKRISSLWKYMSERASVLEMMGEKGQLQARIAALHQYKGKLSTSWRQKEDYPV